MRKYSTVEGRAQYSDVINYAAYGKERVALTRRGKIIAYVVPAEDVEVLESLEDELEIEAAEAVIGRIESGEETSRPLDDVLADMQTRRAQKAKKKIKTA